MAHERKRHIEDHLTKILGISPIVGILGHRQVGKTTLLEKESHHYITLDSISERRIAEEDPDGFVDRFDRYPVGIDECQVAPNLFPALKDRVRRVKRPGQFILTGSLRFTSRKAITESLTGRIINIELHPLMVSELIRESEPRIAKYFLDAAVVQTESLQKRFLVSGSVLKNAQKCIDLSMTQGGLPGICFVRDAALRAQKLEAQFETILTRDLRLLVETTLSFDTVRSVLERLALSQGEPLEYASLSRKTRVSVPALRKLISAFEAMFLIWSLPCIGGEKRPTIFFEDCAESRHLHDGRLDTLTQWTAFIVSQLRSVFDIPISGHEGAVVNLYQYRTRGGAYVPLVVRRGKRYLGVIPILTPRPNAKDLGSSQSFLKANKDSRVMFVTNSDTLAVVGKNAFIVPAATALL